MSRVIPFKRPTPTENTKAFENAEEAWFWFIAAYQARLDGAQIRAGMADVPRPCEPLDIIRLVDRLYRQRLLLIEHMRVLLHYGRKRYVPDGRRPRETKAEMLWQQAMHVLEFNFRRKGIVE